MQQHSTQEVTKAVGGSLWKDNNVVDSCVYS